MIIVSVGIIKLAQDVLLTIKLFKIEIDSKRFEQDELTIEDVSVGWIS